MKRRIFTLVSALSLLMFAATVVLCLRSVQIADRSGAARYRWYDVYSNRGEIEFNVSSLTDVAERIGPDGRWTSTRRLVPLVEPRQTQFLQNASSEPPEPGAAPSPAPAWHLSHDVFTASRWRDGKRFSLVLGYSALARILQTPAWRQRTVTSHSRLRFPDWAAAVASGLLPALWAWSAILRRRQALRRAAGRCLACGYDVRASRHCCPECGTPLTRKPEASS